MGAKLFVKVCFIFSLVGFASSIEMSNLNDSGWLQFKLKFNKTYTNSSEDAEHYRIFKKNQQLVEEYNRRDLVERGSTLELNWMSDWSEKETQQSLGLLPISYNKLAGNDSYLKELNECNVMQVACVSENLTFPAQYDARSDKLVTGIKSQGQCGTCQTFALTAVLESQLLRQLPLLKRFGNLAQLSEQNVLDCTSNSLNNRDGCKKARYYFDVLDFVKEHGIMLSRDYPYLPNGPQLGITCKHDEKKTILKVDQYCTGRVTSDNLKRLLVHYGPVSVGLEAGPRMQLHKLGVYKCRSYYEETIYAGHAVTIVGYGRDKIHGNYWIVKNSWGEDWGEQGYFKLAEVPLDSNLSTCNILNEVIVATIKLADNEIYMRK